MDIGVITNPNSRKNKGRSNRAQELQQIIGDRGRVYCTKDVESIKPVLREFLRNRARFWVADGGDGALHWMLRTGLELLEEDEFAGDDYQLPLTMPTNGGTIDFVAQNVGIEGASNDLLVTLRTMLDQGMPIEEAQVDSMAMHCIEQTDNGPREFTTYGFAAAIGGVGQRFYSKYYSHDDPNTKTILKVVGSTLASLPIAMSPLRSVPGMPNTLKTYAKEMFRPTAATVAVDGTTLSEQDFTGIHIGSMSLNLGGVFRLFPKADQPGALQCLVGSPSPLAIVKSLPAMHFGNELRGRNLLDQVCRQMTVTARGDERLHPIVDGEYYRDLLSMTIGVGPRLRIPRIVAAQHKAA